MNDVLHLDYDALNALKEVMEDDFGLLIETYLRDSTDRLLSLQQMIGGENLDAIRRTAHSFKGSSSNLGAVHLASLCAVIERNALDASLGSLAGDVSRVETEFLIVKQKMQDYLR